MANSDLAMTNTELEARLDGFVREYLKDNSRETIGTYRRALNEFQRYVAAREDEFHFHPEEVEAYKTYLTDERELSHASVSTYLTALRRFCDYLLEIGLLRANPAEKVKGNRRPTEHTRDVLTLAEVSHLLDQVPDGTILGQRDRAIVHCMVHGGLSEVEIARADVQDLDQTLLGWVLRVQGKGRTSKDERIPVDEEVIDAVHAYLAMRRKLRPGHALFVSHGHRSDGRRLNTRSIRNRVDRLLRAAGLKRPGITPHSLTHTAPILWLNKGMTVEEIRRRMRHGTLETTRLYLRQKDDAEE